MESDSSQWFPSNRIRGNEHRPKHSKFHKDMRKNVFTSR